MVFTFNRLLAASGIEPNGVRLLRHRDMRVQKQVFRAAITKDPRFDVYQESQGAEQVISSLRRAACIASFVAGPGGETVFVGMWAVEGPSAEVPLNPFLGEQMLGPGAVRFRTRRLEALGDYIGRLLVEWGPGQRAWVQRAENQDKPIVELRRQVEEPEFPGFQAFQSGLGDIESLPSAWIAALRATAGVYLLVHRERGELYVGSAYGLGGFYGRWLSYSGGHGGNVALREIGGKASDYDVSILETAGSGLEDAEVVALESMWKRKLGSRVRGLNRN
jgi:hypothetical protein